MVQNTISPITWDKTNNNSATLKKKKRYIQTPKLKLEELKMAAHMFTLSRKLKGSSPQERSRMNDVTFLYANFGFCRQNIFTRKNQGRTNAITRQAIKKLHNGCPLKHLLLPSEEPLAVVSADLLSLHSSMNPLSTIPVIFFAVSPHISHNLQPQVEAIYTLLNNSEGPQRRKYN